jgi:hypothetical protein
LTTTYFEELQESEIPEVGRDYYVDDGNGNLVRMTCRGWHWSFRDSYEIMVQFDGLLTSNENVLEIEEVEESLLDYEMEDVLFTDIEDILDGNEARCLMYEAQGNVHRNRIANQPAFDKAFSGFLGQERAPVAYQVDGGKVALTVAMQTASLVTLIACIYLGAWQASLITIPAFLALNYLQLRKST